jgi:hypothetical protein
LAGGQLLIDTNEWGRASPAYYFWSRAVHLKQILKVAQNRLPVRRERQFVRYSTPLESDWRSGIEAVGIFGLAWLRAVLL